MELTGKAESIAVYQTFKNGDKDFSSQLQAIADSGVNTVFLSGDTTDAANILKQAKKMDLSGVTFLGDSTWSTDEFLDLAQKYMNQNVAFSTLYAEKESVTATSEEFLAAYEKEYGKKSTPDAATALGFDAYLIALEAIEGAGEALTETKNFQGASGDITFDSVGDPKKSVVINTFVNKKITPICTIDPQEPEKKADKSKKKEEKENGTEN